MKERQKNDKAQTKYKEDQSETEGLKDSRVRLTFNSQKAIHCNPYEIVVDDVDVVVSAVAGEDDDDDTVLLLQWLCCLCLCGFGLSLS